MIMNNLNCKSADLERISEHFQSQNKSPWIWLFIGDSITHGAAHTHGFRSFPEIFAERIRWELLLRKDLIINSGISGRTCFDLLNDGYDHLVRRHHAEVVFVLIGTNDIARYNDSGLFRQYLTELVDRLRAEGSIPIMQTCTSVLKVEDNEGYILRYNQLPLYNSIIREIAEEKSIILVDHAAHWQKIAADELSLKRLLGEPIHPGGAGHLEMAKEIFRTLGIYDAESNSANPSGTPYSLL